MKGHIVSIIAFIVIFGHTYSFAQEPRYNTPYMSDAWYLTGCGTFNSSDDVFKFLKRYSSFLADKEFQDVDGVVITPAQVIWDAAQTNGVSIELLIFTLEKEQTAITTQERLPDWRLKKLMGYPGCPTVRDQINCGAWQFKRYMEQLNYPMCDGETTGGWRVGISKMTAHNDSVEGCPELEPLFVTPVNCAVAGLFSYTPYIGKYWGGCYKFGGNSLFEPLWEKRFHFCMPIIYVANFWGGTVSVIDVSSLSVKKEIPVADGPRRIAFSPDGRKAFVACSEANQVVVINAETESVIKSIPVGLFPYDIATTPDGKKVYVSNLDSETVSVIDAETLTVIKELTGFREPRAVHVIGDASAHRILVGLHIPPSFVNDAIWVFEPLNDGFLEGVIVGKIPVDMASHRGRGINEDPYVYVSHLLRNADDYNFDLMTLKVEDPNIPDDYTEVYLRVITDRPNLEIEVAQNRVYVSSGTEKVSVYPFLSDIKIRDYYLNAPRGLVRIGNLLFVSLPYENSVYVYDENTALLKTIIPVGSGPMGIAARP